MGEKTQRDVDIYAQAAAVCACANFRKVSRTVTQLFDQALQPSGLRSTQFIILLEIATVPSPTIALLARRLVMDPSTVTRNLRPLEKQGLIKTVSTENRRGRVLTLTLEGHERVEQVVPLWERTQNLFIKKLGQKRWSILFKHLQATVTIAHGISHF